MQNQPDPHLQAVLEALDKGIAEHRKRLDELIADCKEQARLMKAEQKKKLAAARADLRKHEKSRSVLTGEKPERKPRKPTRAGKEAAA